VHPVIYPRKCTHRHGLFCGLFASSANINSYRRPRALKPLSGCEKDVQQVGVDQDGDGHDAVGPRAFHQIQINQHPGETKSDDPGIKAHAYPTKRLGIQASDEIGTKWHSNHNGGNKQQQEVLAFRYEQAKLVIHESGHTRLDHADQCETGPELTFDQTLVIEQNR